MKKIAIKIWEMLNGNKTAIGFLLLLIADKHLADGTLIDTLFNWAGNTLAGTGLFHKVYKYRKNGKNTN